MCETVTVRGAVSSVEFASASPQSAGWGGSPTSPLNGVARFACTSAGAAEGAVELIARADVELAEDLVQVYSSVRGYEQTGPDSGLESPSRASARSGPPARSRRPTSGDLGDRPSLAWRVARSSGARARGARGVSGGAKDCGARAQRSLGIAADREPRELGRHRLGRVRLGPLDHDAVSLASASASGSRSRRSRASAAARAPQSFAPPDPRARELVRRSSATRQASDGRSPNSPDVACG